MATPIRNMRIANDLWTALEGQAKQEGVSITQLVIRYCQQGLGQNVPTSVMTDSGTDTNSLYNHTYSRIYSEAIEPLKAEVEELRTELGKFAA